MYNYGQAFQDAFSNPQVGSTSQLFQNNPQAFNNYLIDNPDAMNQFGTMDFSKQVPGAFGTSSMMQPQQSSWGLSMPSLEQIGATAGIAKDLYGLYSQYEGMDLAKKQLHNQKAAFDFNKTNKQNFINNTHQAFA